MNRRNTIKGLTSIGVLAVIPGKVLSCISANVPTHFIGLGGGGTNILTHFFKNGTEGEFTYITCTEREDLKLADVRFIRFKGEGDGVVSDKVKGLFKGSKQYVLFAGIGGVTGTLLMDEILQMLPERAYRAFCTLPFGFEGPTRQMVSQSFYEKYEGNQSVNFFDMNALMKANKSIMIKGAFDKSHEQLLQIFLKTQV